MTSTSFHAGLYTNMAANLECMTNHYFSISKRRQMFYLLGCSASVVKEAMLKIFKLEVRDQHTTKRSDVTD